MRVRTVDGITHAAYPEWRPVGDYDARTDCNLRIHHCDRQNCKSTRLLSVRIEDDAVVDCMTCLVAGDRQEP
jgi:Pyruvate/2-oxoacid:ferredoxin oxidoreductase delta subunit